MTAITSSGIASGLDVDSLVSQLVAADRKPDATRISNSQSATQTKISALGIFKSALSGFQSAVSALAGASSGLGKLTASSSEDDLFTASASGAVAGTYDVEVLELAKAGKISTGAYASADAAVGTGTVTLSVGSKSFSVTLADGDNSLAKLRDKINAASDNAGVTATLLKGDDGVRLLLTSRDTGTANAVTLTSSAASGGSSFVNTSTVQTAKDARLEVDGFTYTSSSNTVTDAIDGVTINLLKAQEGTTGTLSISSDDSAATAAVQAFVTAYSAFSATVTAYSKYDATSKTAGPLMGDALVRQTQQQIRSIMGGSASSGDYTVLSQIGITTQADGTLALDTAKLQKALDTNPDAVRSLFKGTDGYATKLSNVMDGVLDDDGRLKAETDGLQKTLDDLSKQSDALDKRMTAAEARYRAQFTALDTLMSSLSSTSSYLTQQLANLPGFTS